MLGLLDANFSRDLSIWEVPNDNITERMKPRKRGTLASASATITIPPLLTTFQFMKWARIHQQSEQFSTLAMPGAHVQLSW